MDRQKIARGVGLSEELFKHRIMRRRGGALCHRLIPACLSCRDSTSHEYLWHPRKPGFYIPLRKHISPDCKRDILFRRGTQIQAGDSLGAACYKRLIPAAKAKAVNHTRDIPKPSGETIVCRGWSCAAPWRSRQAYKHHSHPQLSVGAIIEGETRCLCAGRGVPAATRGSDRDPAARAA